jgi:hypothetical protein
VSKAAGLKLAQFLGQLGVFLTCVMPPPPPAPAAPWTIMRVRTISGGITMISETLPAMPP